MRPKFESRLSKIEAQIGLNQKPFPPRVLGETEETYFERMFKMGFLTAYDLMARQVLFPRPVKILSLRELVLRSVEEERQQKMDRPLAFV